MTRREQSCSAVLLVVLSAGLLLTAGGCSSYPEVSSAESQQFIKQVYTACNTQNAERLRKCDERLMELVEAKLVTDREQARFSGFWIALSRVTGKLRRRRRSILRSGRCVEGVAMPKCPR